MGRGVMTHSRAVVVAYASWDSSYEDYCENWDDDPEMLPSEETYYNYVAPEDWQSSKEWFIDACKEMWPSLQEVNDWNGDEVQVVLRNTLLEISVSEFSGMTALCIAVTDDAIDYGMAGLALKNASQMEKNFLNLFSDYASLGTFSNGESVYQKVSN